MFDSIYTGLSGMLAFSKGLDVISNNVTNLNSPGFKSSDLAFRDLFYRFDARVSVGGRTSGTELGAGVATQGTNVRFTQGDLQNTGNQTDAAIDGTGFFIFRNDGQTVYGRAGEFEFDDLDFLVSRVEQERVAGLDSAGNLVDISIAGLRSSPPLATSQVNFIDNLSLGSTEHDVSDVAVFDTLGGQQLLDIKFINNSAVLAGSWLIEVRDANGGLVSSGGEVRFQGDGSPAPGFNAFTFTYSPTGANPQSIELFMGTPGSFDGATSFSGGQSSTLTVGSQDGRGLGALLGVSFERNGDVVLAYSNGATATAGRLALATFGDLQSLVQISASRFLPADGQEPTIAAPTENGMGSIVGSNIELSNVELTQEFTDLIIVQRGFQASSQIVSITNEMLQQLLDMGRTR